MYLIAISPELQKGFKEKRKQDAEAQQSKSVARSAILPVTLEAGRTFDIAQAKETFEATCTQCHGLKNLERAPPGSAEEAAALVSRMVENGLEAPEGDLQQVVFYLTRTYAKQ